MPLGEPISILDISPIALRDYRRRHVVVKAYFDASSDEREEIAITLGGICGTEAAWPRLEESWAAALADISIKEWHTAEQFTRPRTDFWAAATRLFSALLDCWGEMAFSSAVTVRMHDYHRARSEGLVLPAPKAICVDHALEFVVVPTAADFPMFLYFDRTERFMHPLRRVWEKALAKGPRTGWPRQVEQMLPVNSEFVPGLQMADLIAWSANRYQRIELGQHATDDDQSRAMFFNLFAGTSLRHQAKVYDYDTLVRYAEMYERTMKGEAS